MFKMSAATEEETTTEKIDWREKSVTGRNEKKRKPSKGKNVKSGLGYIKVRLQQLAGMLRPSQVSFACFQI